MNEVATTQAKPMQLPAILRTMFADVPATFDDLSGGIVSGFPTISYRGKVWRIRKGGEEQNYLDAQGDAVQSLEVVLVKAHAKPSKIFYDKPFEEGIAEAPRCWSANGETPDTAVQEPISAQCNSCPNNVWGSKINKETGAKGRLCSDTRRIAIVSVSELSDKGTGATKCLLRIPPSSLNPLKDYAEKFLKPRSWPYFAVVTRIGFDPQVAFPKLTFKATRFLTEDEARAVLEIQSSDDVKRILNESTEFAEAAPAAALDDGGVQGVMPLVMQASAPVSGSPAPATVTAPAPVATPARTPPRAPSAIEEETFEVVELTPSAAVAAAQAKKRGRPSKVQGKVSTPPAGAAVESAAAPESAPSEFDSMLDQLLGK
jgi:hypothetical protein